MHHHFIARGLAAMLLAALVLATAGSQAAAPHIVLFLIDDLGHADCGFGGGKDIRTPNIDALAKGGAVLNHHYVQPVCSPTRSALLTGRLPTKTGVYTIVRPKAPWGLPLAERTLAQALGSVGYQCAIVGKWHLGEYQPGYLPLARGFHQQHGHYFGAIDYYTHERDGKHDWQHNDQPLKEEGYSTELLSREACRLIKAHPQGKPLFLYLPFNGIHSPLQVPDKYLQGYDHLQGPRRTLAGMLSAVDEAIGQVLSALQQQDMRKDCLIVFSADNGGPPPGNNGPLRGFKGSLHEGGIRGCAFANWPGHIPAGQRLDEPTQICDWYPTLLKLAGADLNQDLPIDGHDLWPLLTQQAPSPHAHLIVAQSPQQAMIREGPWKLIQLSPRSSGPKAKAKKAKTGNKAQAHSSEPLQLYHLGEDPGETRNLISSQADLAKRLQQTLQRELAKAVPGGDRSPP